MKRERLNPGGDVNEQERGNQIRAAWGGVAPDMSVPRGQGSTLLRAPAATLKDGTEEEESAVGCPSYCMQAAQLRATYEAASDRE